ncbi:hypothetical protein EDC91_11676 [Shewanella fodinae]|uniref:Uncharacterized protein n=1 Tax=Shewanella fodinae TaxID=552357 RepID=A0A4R2FK23_9GAMM|nr:hypothetical protein EDC91_11676 [Shewanella fodinae]
MSSPRATGSRVHKAAVGDLAPSKSLGPGLVFLPFRSAVLWSDKFRRGKEEGQNATGTEIGVRSGALSGYLAKN